jgi:hypothetical protein
VIHERSADGLIATFILDSNMPQTLEVWATKIRTLLIDWPVGEPCLMMHDLRKIDSCMAIKLLQKQVLAVARPDLKLHTALIIDSDATQPCHSAYNSFMSRSTALMWLLAQVNH